MKKKAYITIVLVLLIIIIGKVITRDNLWNFLKTASVSKTKEDKKVLGLNQFYLWTKEDPLFTSPDLDGSAFLEVVQALEKEEKQLQGYLKSQEPIYPVAFLKDVVEVDRNHKEFMSNHSAASAQKLIEAYRAAKQDYKTAAESLNKTLQSGQFPDFGAFVGINTEVSYKVLRADIAKLIENANALGEEIDARAHCLETGKDCKNPLEDLKEPEIKKEDFKFSQKDLLPKNILLKDYTRDAPLYGPYVVYTGCYGFTDDLKQIPYPFYVSEKIPGRAFPQLSYKYLKLATTNYYKRLLEDPDGPGGYLLKSNKQWVQQRETQLYMCNDPSYEANLVEVDNFFRSYNQSLLFKQISLDSLPEDVKSIIQKGVNIEKSFFESEFPSEVNAANVANFYTYFYKILGDWDKKYADQVWLKEVDKNREEYLIRGISYNRKMSNINIIMANALQNINQIRVRFTVAKQNSGAFAFIYGFRNFYGLYYLTFSPSFYRLSEPLAYLSLKKVTIPAESRGAHITYQEALKTHSAAEISTWTISENDLLKVEVEKFKQENPEIQL